MGKKETKTWDDRFCSWKFLFYTLIFFWPLSVYGYFRVKALMKKQGVKKMGRIYQKFICRNSSCDDSGYDIFLVDCTFVYHILYINQSGVCRKAGTFCMNHKGIYKL